MTRVTVPRLWHFTCHHSHTDIGPVGTLLPAIELTDPTSRDQLEQDWRAALTQLVWLTDNRDATQRELGLTRHQTTCDRMQYRYRTRGHHRAVPWRTVRHHFDEQLLQSIERNRAWWRWWVYDGSVNVTLDP